MATIQKVVSVIHRSFIFLLDGINNRVYTDKYVRYLSKNGVHFTGTPNYIAHSAYFDGQGLDRITIGDEVVISREVMLLTHDYSVENALHAVGHGSVDRHIKVDGSISIGDNTFIGARAALLPGTAIGNDCIVGACAVVKGVVPDDSVAVGNPARIIKKTSDFGEFLLTELDEID